MAAISRRPLPALRLGSQALRLGSRALRIGLALSVATAACSLIQPPDTPAQRQVQAEKYAQEGRHADAARAYADLAAAPGADRDYDQLHSASEWLAAGNAPQAKQAAEAVSPDARSRLPVLRALVAADLALADNDGVRAIRELDQVAVPTQPDEAQRYWWIRGKGAFLTNHPVEAVRAYVEREHWLTDPAQLRASRADLYARLRTAAEHGAPLRATANADPVVVGWLELGPVAAQLDRNPLGAAAALANWRRRWPNHPANDSVLAGAQTELAGATQYPDQVALLLPMSGRSEPIGVAVRDGFIAAYLQGESPTRPHVRIYDVAAQSAASAYSQAVADGASFVVGPLTKEDVAAVAPLTAGRAPVLALNFLSDSVAAQRNFYQFALFPEDEARMVARRVAADGRLHGVAIVPDGEWGSRVGTAFAQELAQLGGSVLEERHYEGARADFSDIIRDVLQIHSVKGEPSTHRTDAAFVFIAGTPGAARQIMPQLKFHYAGDVPVYSTSDSFEPAAAANQDIDGLIFPDMPWMISSDPVTTQIRDAVRAAWPARSERRDRLYAFGFDAYRLVPALKSKTLTETSALPGVTGKLRLDDHSRIRRELDFAQIKNGVPLPL
jgi:outer membrane PBP1 activator LpoA protein